MLSGGAVRIAIAAVRLPALAPVHSLWGSRGCSRARSRGASDAPEAAGRQSGRTASRGNGLSEDVTINVAASCSGAQSSCAEDRWGVDSAMRARATQPALARQ